MERAGQEQCARADKNAEDMVEWRNRYDRLERAWQKLRGIVKESDIRDGEHWTRQMERTCEALITGDLAGQLPIDVIDGNRALCETIRKITQAMADVHQELSHDYC